MYLLSAAGRGVFLGFLRNLTPQVLFLALFGYFAARFAVHEQVADLLVSGFSLLVAILAFWANVEELFAGAFSQTAAINAHLEEVKRQERRIPTRIWRMIKFIATKKPVTLLELLLVLLFVYAAIIAILTVALQTTVSLLEKHL